MNTKKKKDYSEKEPSGYEQDMTKNQEIDENTSGKTEETDKVAENPSDEKEALIPTNWEEKYNEMNDSYLRLMAEFDNYRKRTLREKAELIKSGGETVLTNLLPVIDDFERALNNTRQTEDVTAVIQGIELIFSKFIAYLLQQGVKVIETEDRLFNTELYEAIAMIPAQDENLKGKVLDCIQTGYTLYDKVIRHAKVVVGE
jgi:molecular chaperone GrpE